MHQTLDWECYISLSRAKKAAERAAEALSLNLSWTPPARPVTRAVILSDQKATAAKRRKAAEQKRKEQAKWTAQKWRLHWENNLQAY